MSSTGPIPIVALRPVSCGSILWRRGGVARVTIVVKATFGMMHDGNARLIAPMPLVTEDRHAGSLSEPSDLAPFLPNAGVLLWGHACAQQPAPAVAIRLAVYGRERALVDKMVHVFGDRPPGAGSPQPFQTMPIAYERAFGGPAFPDNPVGTGAAPIAMGQQPAPQPNFVHPADPRRPAAFGPVSSHWGSRRRLLGSRAAPALDASGAEIPEGFDFRWFAAAPADQQCAYLQGDEWIVLDGMHPTLPRVQTHLPGARAQVVWVAPGAQGRLLELCADTLLIDADRQRCSLLWRGHFVLEHEGALPHVRAFAGLDMPGYPMAWPDEACVAPQHMPVLDDETTTDRALTGRIVVPQAKLPGLPFTKSSPADLAPQIVSPFARMDGLPFKLGAAPAPPLASPPAPRLGLGDTETSTTSPFIDALPFARRAEPPPSRPTAPSKPMWGDDEHTGMIDLTQPAGWTAPFAIAAPGAAKGAASAPLPGAPWSTPSAAPLETSEPGAQTISARASDLRRRMGGLAPPPLAQPSPPPSTPAIASPAPVMAPPAPVMAPPVPAMAPQVPAMAPPVPAMAPPAPAMAPPVPVVAPPDPVTAPPEPAPADAPTGLRATVLARIKAREPLVDLNLAGADLHDLDLSGAVLVRLDLKGAKLLRCKLVDARLTDAQLVDADLTDADLTGAELSRADLSRATLARARLDGAMLAEANLTGARAQGASLTGAKMARARLSRGEWDGARFDRADLTNADLTSASFGEAHFEGATLIEARLTDARGAGAIFDDARLPSALAHGASFPGASFRRVDAAGSLWEGATLDKASFAGATLKDANLSRASCAGASFAGADASGANLARVAGDGADLSDARLEKADLRQARLRDACFVGAKLRGLLAGKADFSGCSFVRADLQGTTLRAARLGGASFAYANLEGADLRDADFDHTNVFGASRKTAKMGAGAKGIVEIDPGPDAQG